MIPYGICLSKLVLTKTHMGEYVCMINMKDQLSFCRRLYIIYMCVVHIHVYVHVYVCVCLCENVHCNKS